MLRTPAKLTGDSPQKTVAKEDTGAALEAAPTMSIRRMTGEWEQGISSAPITSTPEVKKVKCPAKKQTETLKPKTVLAKPKLNQTITKPRYPAEITTILTGKDKDRLSQAKALKAMADKYLGDSKNIKTEIRQNCLHIIEIMYEFIKEAETKREDSVPMMGEREEAEPKDVRTDETGQYMDLCRKMEEQQKLIQESNNNTERLMVILQAQKQGIEKETSQLNVHQEAKNLQDWMNVVRSDIHFISKSIEELTSAAPPKNPASAPPTVKGREPKKTLELDSVTHTKLITLLERHKAIIRENTEKIEEHKSRMEENSEIMKTLKGSLEKQTYAGVAAASTRSQTLVQAALHSVVITAQDDTETGEEVLSRVRRAVNAKEGGVYVEKVRKAKDRKIIVGCKTVEERKKLKDKIVSSGERLNVEDIKNKDPLVILKDVFGYNNDTDILAAIRKQNPSLFKDLDEQGNKLEIAYKKKTRNPHTSHIVMRVSPKLWQRLVEAEAVRVDLQRVRVADQSPLVQCSLCLGYGHSRRFCKETSESCSHCGGHHMRSDCPEWLGGATASCINCKKAKIDRVEHNAFSQDCPIRKKWDALARATVAYC